MRLWWVRHGPTHEKAFCGWRDVPADLSDHASGIVGVVRLVANTSAEAVRGGATHLVVGRPITAAADPGAAWQAFRDLLEG